MRFENTVQVKLIYSLVIYDIFNNYQSYQQRNYISEILMLNTNFIYNYRLSYIEKDILKSQWNLFEQWLYSITLLAWI